MEEFKLIIDAIGSFLWNNYTLYAVVATGIVFTIWSGFSQYYALTHGFKVIKGDYDKDDDPGAISHFQALSTIRDLSTLCNCLPLCFSFVYCLPML